MTRHVASAESERSSTIAGASALTAAELRLLPMLSTHLSFAEIAAQMFLSRNTISSQAMSVYRKLEVGSRSQAVQNGEVHVARLSPMVLALPE